MNAKCGTPLQLLDGATYQLVDGATNRESSDESPDEAKIIGRVKEWRDCGGYDEMLSHATAELFREELEVCSCISEEPLRAFRGRNDLGPNPVSNINEFGPNPHESSGRYHRNSTGVLYLATTDAGVVSELSKGDSGSAIWVRRFEIPAKRLRIGDFQAHPSCGSKFINQVFFDAERGLSGGPVDRDNHEFSQVVGRLVRDSGFDGMLVPGVRGDRKDTYSNVIVFSCSKWKDWIAEDKPKKIR